MFLCICVYCCIFLETELQWLYIEDKAETLIGRDRELKMLLDYAQQAPELNLEQIGLWLCTLYYVACWRRCIS